MLKDVLEGLEKAISATERVRGDLLGEIDERLKAIHSELEGIDKEVTDRCASAIDYADKSAREAVNNGADDILSALNKERDQVEQLLSGS